MFIKLKEYTTCNKQDFYSTYEAAIRPDLIHMGQLVYQEAQNNSSFSNFNGAVSVWRNLNGASDTKTLVSSIWLYNNNSSKKYGRI